MALTLLGRHNPLASSTEQLRILDETANITPFAIRLTQAGLPSLQASGITVFQINVGKLCNQTCRHCHVDAGPDRTESMSRETAELCIAALAQTDIPTVDITGGEPPITYINTVKLGLSDERIHSLILGYWHTIVTPPMVFARNMVEVKKEMEAKGISKPMVASLAGDVEVEEAAEYLYQNGIPAYAYSTELPVEVLGAKYKWARGAGLL